MNEMNEERELPRNQEAEQAVLGSILLVNEAVITALEFVESADFYYVAHRIIFDAMTRLHNMNQAIDVLTLKDQLERNNQLEDIGGISYLADLTNVVPTAASVEHYSKIVQEASTRRKTISFMTGVIKDAYDGAATAEELVANAEEKVQALSSIRNGGGMRLISDVLHTTVQDIERLSKFKGNVTGLPTGFTELDKITAGLHPGQMIIVGARPGVGKTAFALNLAQNAATKTGGSVAIFNMEMSAEDLVKRMLCAEGMIDATNMKTGQLTPDEWEKLTFAMGQLSRTNIYIDDTAGLKITEMRSKCRKLAQETKDLKLIVIDYLQLLTPANARLDRQNQVSEMSREIKKLALELKVPIVTLTQLSRGVEQRQDKRPVLSDIRESGSIEQDADVVTFLYRDDYYRPEEGAEEQMPQKEDIIEIIVEKNRSGARGTVELIFKKEYNKFSGILTDNSWEMAEGYV
ncbi:MAG: replicative DNA helicase [Lactobacillales bacterium]|nr:replicative DNA helicase [Lactobacillales bacterium]